MFLRVDGPIVVNETLFVFDHLLSRIGNGCDAPPGAVNSR
jgi:hypothetical protein